MRLSLEDTLWLDKAIRSTDIIVITVLGERKKLYAEGAIERGCVLQELGSSFFSAFHEIEEIREVPNAVSDGRVLFRGGKVQR